MKRTGIKRKQVPGQYSTFTKPRKPINKKSPRHKARRQMAKQRYQDGKGVYFDQVGAAFATAKLLPFKRVVNPSVATFYATFGICRRCKNRTQREPHHLTGGSKGRSDEPCNLISLCHNCHEIVQSQPSAYQFLWRAKWQYERHETDWLRLCLLLGRVPFDSLD